MKEVDKESSNLNLVGMTMFIAHKKINDFMRHLDMKGDYKWFVEMVDVSYKTKTTTDEDYYMGIINKSKDEYDDLEFWIPAIALGSQIIAHDTVTVLSDGTREMFIKK